VSDLGPHLSAEVIDGYCTACGMYVPMTIADNDDRIAHDCGRTPPTNMPVAIYACPTCFAYGDARWGCWGTTQHPHPHAYMEPVYDLLAAASSTNQSTTPEEGR
jgi:hypothetical protein